MVIVLSAIAAAAAAVIARLVNIRMGSPSFGCSAQRRINVQSRRRSRRDEAAAGLYFCNVE
jgi:hypothetical protein